MKYIVMTSINEYNNVMEAYAAIEGWQLIVVGDRKGPSNIPDKRIIFLDFESQKDLCLDYVSLCPENHYSRKNIGYLYAMSHGAEVIAEVDDDNFPKPIWGKDVVFPNKEIRKITFPKYVNIYSLFGQPHVWPRGYPLNKIMDRSTPSFIEEVVDIGVWQFLADDDPDVDAIFRLLHSQPITFLNTSPYALSRGIFCPFNSQNTFWSTGTFPYMYLPMSVSFRFTDILRGYVAQRLLWEHDIYLGFGSASVNQIRNPHDLMKDFQDEISMYLNTPAIIKMLDNIVLKGSGLQKLFSVYVEFEAHGFVSRIELDALEGWISDMERIGLLS